ncbi:beta-lactamase family protein [bacterium]|nr:beta-lactamase family protein [bacterium]
MIPPKIDNLATEAIDKQIFPGIEILVADNDSVLFHKAYGYTAVGDKKKPLGKNFLFDLASLTKPLATTCAILHLISRKKLQLDDMLGKFIPEFKDKNSRLINLVHLMTHTSGLPDWVALYEPEYNAETGWKKLMNTPLIHKPGTCTVYSCLGYILLAEIVRRISGESLKNYCIKNLYYPLGLEYLTFNPLEDNIDIEIVPTGFCPHRQKDLSGIVHDENAGLFNGEGGNSGLFGTAQNIHRFCLALLSGGELDGVRILPKDLVGKMFRNHNPPTLIPRSLGWDIKLGKADYWSCSSLMPDGSIGHLGFTGTSLWMDPQTKRIILLLSNRVLISREGNIPQMREFRPLMHSLIISSLFP